MQPIDLHAPLSADLQRVADAVAASVLSGTEGRANAAEDSSPRLRVGVAYSGGVDSTVLAALTARAVGEANTVLLLGVSPSLAKRERRLAHRQAEQLGLPLVEVATNELANADYAANPVDRCYHCKDELFTVLDTRVADELQLTAIAYGENADDASRPDRPGSRAAAEHRVLHPLADAGAGKADVRAVAVELGLASALKPAAPCLASRIPHGEPVSAEKLAAIDLAEDAVLAAGFSDCRVRHHGSIARIEVPADEFHLIADTAVRQELLSRVKAAGFQHATLDLGGIQSGNFTLTLLNRRPEAL
ncbi:ATP-dependent sacrificial sulfur transferase LarE [Tessaracoccus sp. MC1756]|uniref:ATP-dependent sacrificial sulfur transferase LarE n=1 Tax=Tessaracoccus sp. MC1756 TaxID=2760311 RepID=UPI0015FFDE98|nr:ATP-dependent sacrificial sulfur transferase LarE [Tessaracoccus sp. MC1756]MBB1508290.1 ATP-dependent sacrificial sulfur transferase LarE [Tessaracoccus sp. MC1756]